MPLPETYQKKLIRLLTEYNKVSAEAETLKEEKDKLKEHLAKIMHEVKVNELSETDNLGKTWNLKFLEKTRRSTDYVVLAEIISNEDFNRVIETSKYTYLDIRSSKKKKNSLTTIAPVDIESTENTKPNIPIGEIS